MADMEPALQWCYYSQRYTMSSNDYTLTGYLPPYFMNNVTLENSSLSDGPICR